MYGRTIVQGTKSPCFFPIFHCQLRPSVSGQFLSRSQFPSMRTLDSDQSQQPPDAVRANPSSAPHRKIGVAVDLSDESAYAVSWAVQQYLRPGDSVVLLHVSPTSVPYGADWGPLPHLPATPSSEEDLQKSQDDFDAFTISKAADLAKPLRDAQVPYKIHIVKDHDMKERLCLEVERLGLSALIMGSRGFGAAMRGNDGRLGSVSDYCVHHSLCPVIVVRYPDDNEGSDPVVAVNEPLVEVEVEEDENDEVGGNSHGKEDDAKVPDI
ncbi:universal stress protein PHOS32-like isoform X2 [Punica granatum]|uniref:Universal stress protein PHOS32-like isoform X2 n=1 Tax=Punica granatum TaxID=22663 RepID=A0A6P8E592_PUNGR|nr:universal stress protein PHOS32-like isoform X2 [Punica granatum]